MVRSYAPPACSCKQLPHAADCPVAPFFDKSEAITLDSEQGDFHDDAPFIITCPRGCRFTQFEHAVGYDYEAVDASTENTQVPMVCPKCGWSDKQTLPAIVGYDPNADLEDEHFSFQCPASHCQTTYTREDGVVEFWVEQIVLQEVDEAQVRGIWFKRGQIVDRYTELSIACDECGHQVGETDD
jgi:hypothetical protein